MTESSGLFSPFVVWNCPGGSRRADLQGRGDDGAGSEESIGSQTFWWQPHRRQRVWQFRKKIILSLVKSLRSGGLGLKCERCRPAFGRLSSLTGRTLPIPFAAPIRPPETELQFATPGRGYRGRFLLRQRQQLIPQLFDLPPQLSHIQLLVGLAKFPFNAGFQLAGLKQPLVGCPRLIVLPMDLPSHPLFRLQLHRRLEKV